MEARAGAVGVIALVVALALALGGCSGSGSDGRDGARTLSPSPDTTSPDGTAPVEEDQSGGMGVPQLARTDAPTRTGPVSARVQVSAQGCFLARTARAGGPLLVVWPEGTSLGTAGDELVLPTGATVAAGTVLRGRGAVVPVRSLPAYDADGFWAYAVDYCTPGAGRVLVLTEVAAR